MELNWQVMEKVANGLLDPLISNRLVFAEIDRDFCKADREEDPASVPEEEFEKKESLSQEEEFEENESVSQEEEGRAEGSINPFTSFPDPEALMSWHAGNPIGHFCRPTFNINIVKRYRSRVIRSTSVGGNRIQNAIEDRRRDMRRNRLLLYEAVQPGLEETHAIRFLNLVNANLPICKRWGSTMSGIWRNVLDKLLFGQYSGGPSSVNGLAFLKSASRLAVGMILFGNTPAVGAVRAMAPEAAEPGSLQTGDFEKWSNFWFGMVNCIGVLAAIITLIKSFNCKKSHSIAGTSAASAPAGAIMDRAVNKAQTFTVLRAWHETEYCELLVARREEEGAYAP